MSAELSFRDVSYPSFFEGFSCDIMAGSSTLLVTARDVESSLLTRLITGLSYPSQGAVLVNSRVVAKQAPDQLPLLRQRIGIVPSNGGLVSNLKVWENITLPLLYHCGGVTIEEEQTALSYLADLGYSGNVMAMPAHLSRHERQIIALVRAWLTCSDMVVYCNCFEGAPLPAYKLFSRLSAEFHASRPDQISLYLASSVDVAAELTVDTVIHVHEPAETVSRNA